MMEATDKKLCSRCSEHKFIDQFHKNRATATGLSSYCKECCLEYGRKYRKRPESRNQRKQEHLKAYYQIDLNTYNKMLSDQNGVCAVCSKENKQFDPNKLKNRDLHVDHDHETGRIRGLLCLGCNLVLGVVKDDIAYLQSLIVYLEKT